jgi:hypothetical protein
MSDRHLIGWTAGSVFTDATSLGGEVGTKITCTSFSFFKSKELRPDD